MTFNRRQLGKIFGYSVVAAPLRAAEPFIKLAPLVTRPLRPDVVTTSYTYRPDDEPFNWLITKILMVPCEGGTRCTIDFLTIEQFEKETSMSLYRGGKTRSYFFREGKLDRVRHEV